MKLEGTTMQAYDYRIDHKAVNEAETKIFNLSTEQLLKLSETAGELQQALEKAKDYFNKAILPGLKDFAEMSCSVLCIQEHGKQETIQVLFKSETGFDITESCRLMRSLVFMANFIGIMTENEDTILSLIYDYKELLDR